MNFKNIMNRINSKMMLVFIVYRDLFANAVTIVNQRNNNFLLAIT